MLRIQKQALLLLSFAIISDFASSQPSPAFPCKNVEWNYAGNTCPSDFPEEIYREEIGLLSRRMCCRQGRTSKEQKIVEHIRRHARACQATPCRKITKTTRTHDMCTADLPTRVLTNIPFDVRGLYEQYQSGRRGTEWKLEYREEIRESCSPTLPYPSKGITAVCCNSHSDSALLSMYSAEMHEFPYIAHISYNDGVTQKDCGGAIYNDRFVITAAHCVVNNRNRTYLNESGFTITVGSNIGQLSSYSKYDNRIHTVEQVIVYEDYEGAQCKQNDIALVKLTRRIKFGETVKPIQIVPGGFNPLDYADHAITSGWGLASNLHVLPFLRKTNVRIRPDNVCFRYGQGSTREHRRWSANCGEGPEGDRTNQFICVGGLTENELNDRTYKNPIVLSQGDSGSPVVCKSADGLASLCGVVSFGGDFEQCVAHGNLANCPFSAVSEIQNYHDFITTNAGPQDDSTTFEYVPFGEPVSDDEFLHHVHITVRDRRPCGGTLIGPSYVLTAGHCVAHKSPRDIKVTVGLRDLSQVATQVHNVRRLWILDNFKKETLKGILLQWNVFIHHTEQKFKLPIDDPLHDKDLGLIELDGRVSLPDDFEYPIIQPFEATIHRPPHAEAVEVAFPRSTHRSGVLMKRTFTILHKSECLQRVKKAYVSSLPEDIICAVERHSGGSLCDRELGGGLFCGPKRKVLCGIQIFRTCQGSIPSLYLGVGYYNEWMQMKVFGDGQGRSVGGSRGGGSGTWIQQLEGIFRNATQPLRQIPFVNTFMSREVGAE